MLIIYKIQSMAKVMLFLLIKIVIMKKILNILLVLLLVMSISFIVVIKLLPLDMVFNVVVVLFVVMVFIALGFALSSRQQFATHFTLLFCIQMNYRPQIIVGDTLYQHSRVLVSTVKFRSHYQQIKISRFCCFNAYKCSELISVLKA